MLRPLEPPWEQPAAPLRENSSDLLPITLIKLRVKALCRVLRSMAVQYFLYFGHCLS
jgi:hypothetical protein